MTRPSATRPAVPLAVFVAGCANPGFRIDGASSRGRHSGASIEENGVAAYQCGRAGTWPAPHRADGIERKLGEHDIIVSKTDTKGRITYANRIFVEIAAYRESEVLGRPHNLIRHPQVPRAVFALLWERVQAKRELFAYVVERCKGGDRYWVLAHVTPSVDAAGTVVGYHANRRRPGERALQPSQPLYAELLGIETSDTDRRRGLERSSARLHAWAAQQGKSYDALLFAL